MTEKVPKTPKCRLHRATGQAVVTIDGRDYYLGPHKSKASRSAYDALIGEWLAGGRCLRSPDDTPAVSTVLIAYLKHAKTYYIKNGRHTREVWHVKHVMKPLKLLYGKLPVTEFTPLKLKAIQQRFIDEGHSRTYINDNIGRIKRIFKWGVHAELIPETTYRALATMPGLRRGRTTAPEGNKITPVPDAYVDTVQPFLLPQVWTLIQLQRLTGMRSAELTIMRGCDIETGGKIWLYRPESHKSQHHGYDRIVELGPRAKKILKPYLKSDTQAYLFSPIEAMEQRRVQDRLNRKTRVQPSQLKRKPKRKPKRTPNEHYTTDSYRRAIHRACELADIPKWSPHRLRHNYATMVRKEYGIETARILLGHRSAFTTEIYAEIDREKARAIVAKIG